MSYLTQRTLPRRTVLKGLGASLSLPLLDAMIPLNASAHDLIRKVPLLP